VNGEGCLSENQDVTQLRRLGRKHEPEPCQVSRYYYRRCEHWGFERELYMGNGGGRRQSRLLRFDSEVYVWNSNPAGEGSALRVSRRDAERCSEFGARYRSNEQ
jgi:hypothetical protein